MANTAVEEEGNAKSRWSSRNIWQRKQLPDLLENKSLRRSEELFLLIFSEKSEKNISHRFFFFLRCGWVPEFTQGEVVLIRSKFARSANWDRRAAPGTIAFNCFVISRDLTRPVLRAEQRHTKKSGQIAVPRSPNQSPIIIAKKNLWRWRVNWFAEAIKSYPARAKVFRILFSTWGYEHSRCWCFSSSRIGDASICKCFACDLFVARKAARKTLFCVLISFVKDAKLFHVAWFRTKIAVSFFRDNSIFLL